MPQLFIVQAVSFSLWFLICALVAKTASTYHRSSGNWFLLSLLCSPATAFVILFFLWFLVGGVQSPVTCFMVALVPCSLLAFPILVFLGKPLEAMALRDKEERIRQLHPELKEVREAAVNEMNCPGCGAIVNPITMDGLHSSEKEPWLLICNQCDRTIEPEG